MLKLINSDAIQSILKKRNFAPNKFLGQNFLADEEVLEKIIEAADLRAGDNVIEIGPGLGVLTEALLARGANVAAIEKDKDLIPALEENLKEHKNLKIVHDDFLQVDFGELVSGFFCHPELSAGSEGSLANARNRKQVAGSFAPLRMTAGIYKSMNYKVVSNIPYYITSPVLRKILTAEIKPEKIVFLVQREVAERISAKHGDMSVISVFVQFYGTPSVEKIVKPQSFWPAPKVESAILKIILDRTPALAGDELKAFWRLVKIGFSSRRKTLANNLAAGFSAFGGSHAYRQAGAAGGHTPREKIKKILETLGFTDKTRAQELSVEDWLKLREKFI